jgi:hypothetical protein
MSSVRSIHSRGWRFFIPGGRCGAYAAKRRQAAAEKALRITVQTSSAALKEVERLRSENEMLEATAAERMFDLVETRQRVQSLEEERDHLRADADELMQRVREFQKSVDADSQSVLETSWDLVKQLREANHEAHRLRSQRRILARHLRKALRKGRAFDRLCDEIDVLFHFWWPLNVCWDAIVRGARRFRLWVERAILIPVFGRRSAADVQEALNHG